MALSPNINNLEKNKFRDSGVDSGSERLTRVASGIESSIPLPLAEPDSESILVDKVSETVTYFGRAAFGSSVSAASWKIQKIETDGTITSIKNASNAFDQAWNSRLGLSYS